MNIFKIELPIPNYDRTRIHYQEFYFQSEACPTQAQVINFLRKKLDEVRRDPHPLTGLEEETILDCLRVFEMYKPSYVGSNKPNKEWPFKLPLLTEGMHSMSEVVCHPEFGATSACVTHLVIEEL